MNQQSEEGYFTDLFNIPAYLEESILPPYILHSSRKWFLHSVRSDVMSMLSDQQDVRHKMLNYLQPQTLQFFFNIFWL